MARRRARRDQFAILSLILLVSSLFALPANASQPGPGQPGQGWPTWPSHPDWQRYVESSTAPFRYPVQVVSTSGGVSNPEALTHPGSGTTTITRGPNDPAPVIVLDYGADIGGVPEFGISSESGSPTLTAGYAEVNSFLTAGGDGGRPFESGDPSRGDSYPVTGPGVISNRFIQGGERYQELTLAAPGTVSLSFARIRSTVYPAAPADYAGYFVSSSDELNRLWYAGVNTLDLNMLPPNSPGGFWTIGNGLLNDTGGDTGLLRAGYGWTDYTMSFRTRIGGQQSGFVVRGASIDDKYLLILDDSADHAGPANSLQEVVFTNGQPHTIADIPLAKPITPGSWHDVSVAVRGTTVTTTLDGTQAGSFDSSAFPAGVNAIPAGSIGFREDSGIGESTDFTGLTVTAPSGKVLYCNGFTNPASIADFQAPGVNQGSLILDGAKRDRDVWEGDLSAATPTLYYSLDQTQYVRDSLRLLGSYQLQSGFIEGRRAPGDPLNTSPLPGETNQYSASYSMYFVANLDTYYQYTGDAGFLRQEWPIVQRELAWNAKQVDANGLFVTNSSDGNNWHYDDQNGEQTYYNALYYRVLLAGADIADTVGDKASATAYRSAAASVKTAVNANLFNATTGVYDISTTQRGYVAQDANVYAVRYGIAPADKAAGILATLSKNLGTAHGDLDVSSPAPAGYHQIIGPFMGSYDLWTRFGAGDTAGAYDLLDREWGQMTTGDPGGVLWEVMGTDGTVHTPGINGQGNGATSMAHAWSTGPTSALSEYVLGISPTGPGFSSWQVAPQPGNLSWAQGRTPTPHGPLSVAWAQGSGRFSLDVTPPAGANGTIFVPLPNGSGQVSVNGAVVLSGGKFHPSACVSGAAVSGSSVRLSVHGCGGYRVLAG